MSFEITDSVVECNLYAWLLGLKSTSLDTSSESRGVIRSESTWKSVGTAEDQIRLASCIVVCGAI